MRWKLEIIILKRIKSLWKLLWVKLGSRHCLTPWQVAHDGPNKFRVSSHHTGLFLIYMNPGFHKSWLQGSQGSCVAVTYSTVLKCPAAVRLHLQWVNGIGVGAGQVYVWEKACACESEQRPRTKLHFIDKISHLSFLSELTSCSILNTTKSWLLNKSIFRSDLRIESDGQLNDPQTQIQPTDVTRKITFI